MAMNLLESLGFIINKEKSVLSPTRIITFLGSTINSITMLFILPSKKNNNDRYIIAYHVPGKTNVVTDQESREFWDNSDWMLDPSTDDLHQLEARPPVSSFGCILLELETPSGLHIPPIQFN
jgi:hypothetical protein